jgi:hypothetical protein
MTAKQLPSKGLVQYRSRVRAGPRITKASAHLLQGGPGGAWTFLSWPGSDKERAVLRHASMPSLAPACGFRFAPLLPRPSKARPAWI